jgi:hypothetical protein
MFLPSHPYLDNLIDILKIYETVAETYNDPTSYSYCKPFSYVQKRSPTTNFRHLCESAHYSVTDNLATIHEEKQRNSIK